MRQRYYVQWLVAADGRKGRNNVAVDGIRRQGRAVCGTRAIADPDPHVPAVGGLGHGKVANADRLRVQRFHLASKRRAQFLRVFSKYAGALLIRHNMKLVCRTLMAYSADKLFIYS